MTDIEKVRELLAEGIKEAGISTRLKITRHRARQLVAEVERGQGSTAVAVIPPTGLPALSFYDTARKALAEAKTLHEVKDIADKTAAMAEYARRANDISLEMDAVDLRAEAEAEWGRRYIEMKKADRVNTGTRGQLKGAVPVGGNAPQPPTDTRLTLADLNVTKQFSARAQKLGSISERALAARLATRRENAERGAGRVTADILKQKPGNTPRARGRAESDDALDYFPTPPWATRALMERVLPLVGINLEDMDQIGSAWEPACGEGHMSGVLNEYFSAVTPTDIFDYGQPWTRDFLAGDEPSMEHDWIITNPPFKGGRAEAFVLRALDLAREGVAMFVALQFLESIGRYEQIFKNRPPTLIAFFAERVPICKGRWDPDASSDAAYLWLVWKKDQAPQPPFWIPPGQREALTRPDDRERFAAWSMPDKSEAAE